MEDDAFVINVVNTLDAVILNNRSRRFDIDTLQFGSMGHFGSFRLEDQGKVGRRQILS